MVLGIFKKSAKQIKKITLTKNEDEFIKMFSKSKRNFDVLQKKWFGSTLQDETEAEPSADFYVGEIATYIDLAISMYAEAISHKTMKKVTQLFSKHCPHEVEPQINIEFDSSTWTINISELWQSELNLDRETKNECVNLSSIVWYDYRASVDVDQLQEDAKRICFMLRQKYPSTEIAYLIKDDCED